MKGSNQGCQPLGFKNLEIYNEPFEIALLSEKGYFMSRNLAMVTCKMVLLGAKQDGLPRLLICVSNNA